MRTNRHITNRNIESKVVSSPQLNVHGSTRSFTLLPTTLYYIILDNNERKTIIKVIIA